MLAKILEYEKQFDPVDQYEITDAIGYLYEEIRAIPEDDEVIYRRSHLQKQKEINDELEGF